MAGFANKQLLAAVGTTGNVVGSGISFGAGYRLMILQFVVEAVGATPTVTYKFQGSIDNVNWYDLGYVTDASDTIAVATRTATAVGAQVEFLSNPEARQYQFFRVVTTSNTNVTFRAEAYPIS